MPVRNTPETWPCSSIISGQCCTVPVTPTYEPPGCAIIRCMDGQPRWLKSCRVCSALLKLECAREEMLEQIAPGFPGAVVR